jgi:hypothetical protein
MAVARSFVRASRIALATTMIATIALVTAMIAPVSIMIVEMSIVGRTVEPTSKDCLIERKRMQARVSATNHSTE